MNKAEVSTLFAQQFNEAPLFVIASPGRINLIGEHVDYNHGFVLPAAIDKYMYVITERERMAQLVEGRTPVKRVAGSNPGTVRPRVMWGEFKTSGPRPGH